MHITEHIQLCCVNDVLLNLNMSLSLHYFLLFIYSIFLYPHDMKDGKQQQQSSYRLDLSLEFLLLL